MRKREKLTPEERFALALALVKREQSLAEICLHYQVSHTTAYKLRNAFLDGARQALAGGRGRTAEGARDQRDDDLVGPDGAGDLVGTHAAGDLVVPDAAGDLVTPEAAGDAGCKRAIG